MAQFDVHQNLNPRTRKRMPFLVDVQLDLLRVTELRVVIPLVTNLAIGKDFTKLHPVFEIEGLRLHLNPQQIAGVDRRLLGPTVANVAARREDIIGAMDYLLTGV